MSCASTTRRVLSPCPRSALTWSRAGRTWRPPRKSRPSWRALSPRTTRAALWCHVKGVRVFVPASQTGLPRETPMSELVKKKVRLVITEVNRARHRVVGSIRQGAARRARRRRREGLGRDRGRQALHRRGEVPDFLRRFRGHRRRGRHGPHLRAVLEPHQAPLRGGLGGRHRGCVCDLRRQGEEEDLPGHEGPQPGPLDRVHLHSTRWAT